MGGGGSPGPNHHPWLLCHTGILRDHRQSQGEIRLFQLSPKSVGFCPLPRTFLELRIAEVQFSKAVTFHVESCHSTELRAALRSEPRTASKLLATSPLRSFGSAGVSLSISPSVLRRKQRSPAFFPTGHCDTANQLARDAEQVPSQLRKRTARCG